MIRYRNCSTIYNISNIGVVMRREESDYEIVMLRIGNHCGVSPTIQYHYSNDFRNARARGQCLFLFYEAKERKHE